jgi:hypothetical protein
MEQSTFGRLAGVLVSPTKTFKAIAEKPTWAVALLILVVIGVLTGVLMSGRVDWADVTRDSLEAQGQELPEEQLDRIIDFQEKAGPALMIGGSLVAQPLVYMLLALVFMVVFKMLGGDLNFLRSFSVILHGMMPRAVMGLLSIPVILGKDEFGFEELKDGTVLTSNLGAFAPEDAGTALVALLSSVDLFSLWVLALLIIGYGTVAKVSKGAATGGVIALWIVYLLGKIGLAALRG